MVAELQSGCASGGRFRVVLDVIAEPVLTGLKGVEGKGTIRLLTADQRLEKLQRVSSHTRVYGDAYLPARQIRQTDPRHVKPAFINRDPACRV